MNILASFTTSVFFFFCSIGQFCNFLIHIKRLLAKKTSANIMEKMILKIGGRDIILEILLKLK